MDLVAFKEKLDNTHTFPTTYTYKFIVTSTDSLIQEVRNLFKPESTLILKQSSNKKYTSVTAKQHELNSDHIIDTYLKAKEIQGIISL